MNQIKTVSQLTELLAEDLQYRKRELTTLKLLLDRSRAHEESVVLRTAICMLYAHWEGFIKTAATAYLGLIALQGLKYSDLTSNFMAFRIRPKINAINSPHRIGLFVSLLDEIVSIPSEKVALDWQAAIFTGSNLTSELFFDILLALGIDNSLYKTRTLLIDSSLLGLRNAVAHGEKTPINRDDYIQLYESVTALIEQFRDDVENAAVGKRYLQVP